MSMVSVTLEPLEAVVSSQIQELAGIVASLIVAVWPEVLLLIVLLLVTNVPLLFLSVECLNLKVVLGDEPVTTP